MTPKDQQPDAWFNSLGAKLFGLLLIALLPVGLIAVMQTRQIGIEAQKNAELAIVALNEQAAVEKRLAIEKAFGSAQALAASSSLFRHDPRVCVDLLGKFVATDRNLMSAVFIPPDGRVRCSFNGNALDMSADPTFMAGLEQPRRIVDLIRVSHGSGVGALMLYTPVVEDGRFEGFVRITFAVDRVNQDAAGRLPDTPTALFLTTGAGQTLALNLDQDAATDHLPANMDVADLITAEEPVLYTQSKSGSKRLYAASPVIEGALHVLGVWEEPPNRDILGAQLVPLTAFPLIMWVASMLVSLFAVYRLVIRHINRLGGEMRDFASDRTLPADLSEREMPAEMFKMSENFRQMATSIMQDEAALEDSLRENKLLLKEVHHRVKNNLQLISSIINMQIRKTPDPDTQFALKRVQERVVSLATIHRDLYQSDEGGHINAGKLLEEIVEHSMQVGADDVQQIEKVLDIDMIWLLPDQAVPLSLLAAEASTNALKYMGATDGAQPWYRVRFHKIGETECEVLFENSISGERLGEGTGLGTQLINAFSVQLGGQAVIEDNSDSYALRIRFDIMTFAEAADY